MLFILVPPPTLSIPDTLNAHSLESVSTARIGKEPLIYVKARKALNALGIYQVNKIPDKAVWITESIQEVRFDLETLELVIEFKNGTNEIFELCDDDFRSEEEPIVSQDFSMGIKNPTSTPRSTKLFSKLYDLCKKVKPAWDVISNMKPWSENDLETLLTLASNPNAKIPNHWLDDGDTEMEDEIDDGEMIKVEIEEEQKFSGQFTRRRSSLYEAKTKSTLPVTPTRSMFNLNQSDSPKSISSSDSMLAGLVATIETLSSTRRSLIDIYSLYVIPLLKTRLPPTFSLYQAVQAEKWVEMRAISEAGELAKVFTEVLSDENGEIFDCSSDEEASEMSDEDEEDKRDRLELLESARAVRRETRMKANILYTMRDDWNLLRWIKLASTKAEKSRATYDGTHNPPISVSPYPVDFSDSSKKKSSTRAIQSKTTREDFTPSTSPLSSESLPRSETTEEDSEEEFLSNSQLPTFFVPFDPLNQKYLPKSLPRSLLDEKKLLGPDMVSLKRQICRLLYQIAGYNKKLLDLSEFIAEQQITYEFEREEERSRSIQFSKVDLLLTNSALGEETKDLARRRLVKNSTTIVPLAEQKLSIATADKVIHSRLTSFLESSSSPERKLTIENPALAARIKTVANRRKKIINLTSLAILGTDIESSPSLSLNKSSNVPSTSGSVTPVRKEKRKKKVLDESSPSASDVVPRKKKKLTVTTSKPIRTVPVKPKGKAKLRKSQILPYSLIPKSHLSTQTRPVSPDYSSTSSPPIAIPNETPSSELVENSNFTEFLEMEDDDFWADEEGDTEAESPMEFDEDLEEEEPVTSPIQFSSALDFVNLQLKDRDPERDEMVEDRLEINREELSNSRSLSSISRTSSNKSFSEFIIPLPEEPELGMAPFNVVTVPRLSPTAPRIKQISPLRQTHSNPNFSTDLIRSQQKQD